MHNEKYNNNTLFTDKNVDPTTINMEDDLNIFENGRKGAVFWYATLFQPN
jgi:hypothetical protein